MYISEYSLLVGFATGLFNCFYPFLSQGYPEDLEKGLKNIASAFLAFCVMQLISKIGQVILKKPCLGRGDSKLTAIGALWLGFEGIILAISMAFVSAAFYVSLLTIFARVKSYQPFPFTPFISVYIFIIWLVGKDFWIKLWFDLWRV